MTTSHKNILLLIADDLGRYVGCYGCNSVKTPNLDRLAAQGTKFDMAFAATPSCSGSRTVIYTGLHTHENGQYGLQIMGKRHFQTFDHVDSGPKLFNQAGYLTGILGKVHVGSEEVFPWTYREESESRDVAWIADRAEAFFKQAKVVEKPFWLTVGYIDPHRDITSRSGFGNHGPFDTRVKDLEVKPNEVEVPMWLSDLSETRHELVEHYKSIHRMDQGIGLILQKLEAQGLAESTLVVFTSDNGPPFINSKTTMYDAGINLPMLVRQPDAESGIINPNMISYVDILPTLLDWAGIDPTTRIHPETPMRRGRSFLPILEREDVIPESDWQHHVFGSHTFHELQNYYPTRYLRDRKYKYHRNIAWRLDFPFASDLYASITYEGIRNSSKPVMIGKRSLQSYLFRPPEALYDIETDPEEVKNLAEDPAHAERLRVMRHKLEVWQQETGDLWLNRDGVSMKMMERYAKEELHIPDRFDVDAAHPGNRGVSIVKLAANFLS